jgi:integrase
LRVQDLDFEMKQLTVRDGKGAKDRFTVLAEGVIPPLREHLAGVQLTHQEDLAGGYGAVYLPGALDRKYPKAAREWGWQYVFPARDLSRDPRSEVTRRHHLDEGTINKAIKPAVARVGIVKRASSHTFRQNAECREMPSELSQTVRALRDSCVLGSMDSAFSEALQER